MKRFRVTFEGCTIIEAENEEALKQKLDDELSEMEVDYPLFSGLLLDIEEEAIS